MDKQTEEMIDTELLIRNSKLLFPELEDWQINIAVEAHVKSHGTFCPHVDVDIEEVERIKQSMTHGLTYDYDQK